MIINCGIILPIILPINCAIIILPIIMQPYNKFISVLNLNMVTLR